MRISDWSSDVCSSDLLPPLGDARAEVASCRNNGAVFTSARRLPRPHDDGRGLARPARALAAMAEHRGADREQYQPAVGVAERAAGGDQRRQTGPARGGNIRIPLPGRATPGVATARLSGL